MRSPEEKAQRAREYRAYLKSGVWKAVRGAAIYRAGGVCQWCKGAEDLQVHHVRYPKALGTETPDMLMVLCELCHAEAHGRPFIIAKQSRAKRKAHRNRKAAVKREMSKAKEHKRAERSLYRKAEVTPTPSLKDRY